MSRVVKIIIGIIAVLAVAFFVFRTPDIPLEEIKAKYADEASQYIQVDGLNVHYKQEGSGPNLLFLHGTASSLHTWDGWVNELKNDFRITRLDLPAFGITGAHPNGNYSMDFYVSFLDKFISQLELDTIFLAGNSLGGGISWSYTLHHPYKVKKLILLDAAGYPSGATPFVFKLAKNDFTARLLKNITPRSFIEKNIKEVYYDDSKITDKLIDRYYELALAQGNRQAFVDRARTIMTYEFYRIPEIKTPTLIMWGQYDEWINVDNGRSFDKDLPNSKIMIYECGHVPMEELPTQTGKDARSFLISE
ncbi:alpha/beta fold hydrolase [Fulvivirga lutimaris]|uniref:alpha/beta fold hydrolase n=1 Tax=Fulvivirga lutimaris TaxID=1819566 RepID=UPI0012BBD0FF|nr:alpha/beta hydrolase [Fulvivirga lutimaris]MTI40280.1 alpha/beta hydrolase [Fulvivirga lutimaris]